MTTPETKPVSLGYVKTVLDLEKEIEALRAQVEQYQEDAERYRWLRDRQPGASYRIEGMIYSDGFEAFDAAIDKARKT